MKNHRTAQSQEIGRSTESTQRIKGSSRLSVHLTWSPLEPAGVHSTAPVKALPNKPERLEFTIIMISQEQERDFFESASKSRHYRQAEFVLRRAEIVATPKCANIRY